jgi:hypothetical protein
MGPAFSRKYATALSGATRIGIPMPVAGSSDFATGSDWTPATGDVKVSIDYAAATNITTLPTYSNGQWIFTLSAAELTGKVITVAIVDSATKAVADQFFVVETFGNASAFYQADLSDPNLGLARLDAAITSRAAPGAAMTLEFTQAVPTSNAAETLGDCLHASRVQGFGAWVKSGTTLTLKNADGTTAHTFTLDSSTAPQSRT